MGDEGVDCIERMLPPLRLNVSMRAQIRMASLSRVRPERIIPQTTACQSTTQHPVRVVAAAACEVRYRPGYLSFGPAPRCTCMHSKAWLARACRPGYLAALALHARLSAHVAFPPTRAAPGLLAHAWGHKKQKYI